MKIKNHSVSLTHRNPGVLTLIVVAVFLFSPFSSFSQFQLYGTYTLGQKISPGIDFYGTKKISKKVGVACFLMVENGWAEGLAGINYSPAPWITLEADGGIETTPTLYRLSASLWMGNDLVAFQSIFSKGDGRDNWWYKAMLLFNIGKKVSLGAMAWRYAGAGPYCGYRIGKLHSAIWTNPVYDFESKNARIIVGVDVFL